MNVTELRRDLKRQLRREIDSYKILCLKKQLEELPKPEPKPRYKTARVNGKVVPEHRHVAGLEPGIPLDVHHRDGDGRNNVHTNLEPMTHQENCHLRGKRQNTSSQFIGAYFDRVKQCWRSRIKLADGTTKHVGYFKIERDAAMAYDQAAIEEYGLGAKKLNFYKADNIVELMKTVRLDSAFLFRQAAQIQSNFKRRALGAVAPIFDARGQWGHRA